MISAIGKGSESIPRCRPASNLILPTESFALVPTPADDLCPFSIRPIPSDAFESRVTRSKEHEGIAQLLDNSPFPINFDQTTREWTDGLLAAQDSGQRLWREGEAAPCYLMAIAGGAGHE